MACIQLSINGSYIGCIDHVDHVTYIRYRRLISRKESLSNIGDSIIPRPQEFDNLYHQEEILYRV